MITSNATVFVSYAGERKKDAEETAAAIESRGGASCFVCHRLRDFPPGFGELSRDEQQTYLDKKIAESRGVLVIWDRNYARAAWCLWELRSAIRHGKPIVVTRLDATPLPRAISDAPSAFGSAGLSDAVQSLVRGPEVAQRLDHSISVIDPAFSLLESGLAPRFATEDGADVRRAMAVRFGPVAVSLLVQALIYSLVALVLPASDDLAHVWSLLTVMSAVISILGATMISVRAAAVSAPVVLGSAGLALCSAPGVVESIRATSWLVASAGAGSAVLILLGREALTSDGSAHRPPTEARDHLSAGVGAILAAVLTASALWVLPGDPQRLRSLEDLERSIRELRDHDAPLDPIRVQAAIAHGVASVVHRFPAGQPRESLRASMLAEAALAIGSKPTPADIQRALARLHARAQRELDLDAPDDVPVTQGGAIGLVLGFAVAATLYRRRLNSFRATDAAKDRSAGVLAGLGLLGSVGVGAAIGYWIQHNAETAARVGWVAGAYAGLQVGLICVAVIALPIALSASTLGPRAQRLWGVAALAGSTALVATLVRRMPFGRFADDVGAFIELGAVFGGALATVSAATGLVVLRAVRRARTRDAAATEVPFVPIDRHELALASSFIAHAVLVCGPHAIVIASVLSEPPAHAQIVTVESGSGLGDAPVADHAGVGGEEERASQGENGTSPEHPTYEEMDEMSPEQLRPFLAVMTAQERGAWWGYWRERHAEIVRRVEERERRRADLRRRAGARAAWDSNAGGGGGGPLRLVVRDDGSYFIAVAPGYRLQVHARFDAGVNTRVDGSAAPGCESLSRDGAHDCNVEATASELGRELAFTGPRPCGLRNERGSSLTLRFEDAQDGDCNEPVLELEAIDEWTDLLPSP